MCQYKRNSKIKSFETEKLESIEGVKGAFVKDGQLQIIIGTGAVGAMTDAVLDIRATAYGVTGIPGFLITLECTTEYAIMLAVSGGLAFLLTWLTWHDDSAAKIKIYAPVAGKIIKRNDIPDRTFAEGVLGECIAIMPECGEIVAPFDSTVRMIADQKHAVGLTSAGGAELLIHVGLDTVKLNGDGFEVMVKENEMRSLTELMISRGKNNVGYVGVTMKDEAAGKERYRGFCDAVKEAGHEEWAENYVLSDFSVESGYEYVKVLVEKNKNIDGIVCATDNIAVGVMMYLKEKGKKIPGEVAVMGMGDTKISRIAEPSFSTVHYYYEDCGIKASEILIEIITTEKSSVGTIKMGYFVIENET